MKKMVILLLVLCMAYSFVGCTTGDTRIDTCYGCNEQEEVKNFKGTGCYLCDECAAKSITRKCNDCGKKGVVLKGTENDGTWLCDECYEDLFNW